MRTSRRSRTVLAAALALPVITVPTVAASAAVVVDARPAFAGGGFGSPWGYGQLTPNQYSTPYAQLAATQDATAATTAESTGIVLIDTVIDYGQEQAAGTGMVLSSDGTVVTNHHVVAGATSIKVTVPSTGQVYDASVVGYDATRDVAVLKLSGASGLATVTTDRAVSLGEAVTAVGNAEGAGTLSAASGAITKRRTAIDVTEDSGSTSHLAGLIETSADVVSGDSGGALLDAEDEVVGMNVAASSQGFDGYAIPIARVLRVADRILAGSASSSVVIGSHAALGVELSGSSLQVVGVLSGGAAATAGISAGDTLTSVGGVGVDTYAELTGRLADYQAGDRVSVGWTDAAGSSYSSPVTLGTAPVG